MEEYEKVKSTDTGVTLIEVMVSLVIFSCVVGFSSGLVKQGMQYPFAAVGVEKWINLAEDTGNRVLNLSSDDSWESVSRNSPLFDQLKSPIGTKDWELSWEDCNLPGVKVAVFSLQTLQGKPIEWRIYKQFSE